MVIEPTGTRQLTYREVHALTFVDSAVPGPDRALARSWTSFVAFIGSRMAS